MNQIASIQAGEFACFEHLTPEVRNEQIKSLFYIERMAGVSNTDISKVDIFDVFGRKEADKALLVTSKGEINKRLLALSQRAPAEPNRVLDEAQVASINAMNSAFMKRQTSRLDELKRNRASHISNAEGHITRVNEGLRQAWEIEVEINRISGHTPDFKTQFQQIQADGFWEFLETLDGKVMFVTKSDVVMSYKNKLSGVDIQVNMGRYKAAYHAGGGGVILLPYQRNPYASNAYYHPYVNSGGSICFGNAATTAAKLLTSMQLTEYFSLLAALLTTYDIGSNPYQSLDEFDKSFKAGIFERKTPCPACGGIKGACSCKYCPKCAQEYTRRECPSHWCKYCETYNKYDCDCCQECGTSTHSDKSSHESDCSEYEETDDLDEETTENSAPIAATPVSEDQTSEADTEVNF